MPVKLVYFEIFNSDALSIGGRVRHRRHCGFRSLLLQENVPYNPFLKGIPTHYYTLKHFAP